MSSKVMECKPCNWFLTMSALRQQRKWGIQGKVPRCPECKRRLTEGLLGKKSK